MKQRAAMKKDELTELIKHLENARVPDIELKCHQSRLKAALLTYSHSNKQQEATFLKKATAGAMGNIDSESGVWVAHRPIWKTAMIAIMAIVVLLGLLFTIPQTSSILKSTFFPEGSKTVSGPQLTADEREKAMDILMADSRIKEIMAQGAVIDKILPIEVISEAVNSETGKSEVIKETWAQAWLVLRNQDWGVQIDLVRGQIISITP